MTAEFKTHPLAITDVETTGLRPVSKYEIIDIGLVLMDQETLQILDTWQAKIKPEHIETADPEALKYNGYNEKDWQDAISLREAMEIYAQKTKGAMMLAHNITLDWEYIELAFEKTGVEDLMDYHRRDLSTLASEILRYTDLAKENLNELAKFLGLPGEPTNPKRAINGAKLAYEVYCKLRRITDKRLRDITIL